MSAKKPAMIWRALLLMPAMTVPDWKSAGLPGYSLEGRSKVMLPLVLT